MTRRILLVGLFFPLLTGCGGEEPVVTRFPVIGTISRVGKPVTEGGLIFMPESGQWGGVVVDAAVKPDGTFLATTTRTTGFATTIEPGAPAGRYKVVYHPPSDGQTTGLETELPDVVVIEKRDNTITLVLPEVKPLVPDAAAAKQQPSVEEKK